MASAGFTTAARRVSVLREQSERPVPWYFPTMIVKAPSPRLAEVFAALSLSTDLGLGAPPESAMRACLLSLELGRAQGLTCAELACVYYGALLRHIGCTSVAHEESLLVGDDIQLKQALLPADPGRPLDFLHRVVRDVGHGAASPAGRLRRVARFLAAGQKGATRIFLARCEIAERLATRLGLGKDVVRLLWEASERWDGSGLPRGLAAEALGMPARVLMVAEVASLFCRLAGPDAAREEVERRSGTHLDPAVSRTFAADARGLLSSIAGQSVWGRVLDAEPGEHRSVAAEDLEALFSVMSDFADLKSVYTLGHSHAVAALAEAAGQALSLDSASLRQLRLSALVHDLGRASVPNSIWDKPGPLDESEWERVRTHVYCGEQVLRRVPAFRALAELAASDHERLDGSGYHRRVPAAALPRTARLLAAADVYRSLIEDRAHRPAFDPEGAARILLEEVTEGRLDREAVNAVLGAAGHAIKKARSVGPRGLSEREVEVLRLLARGLSNKQIAARLRISPRTVQHHTIHIYAKIGVETRAAAALFATENDLLHPG